MTRFQRSAVRTCTVYGFSIVELMVAITLGLIVTGAVIQIFVASRSTYNFEEGVARMQENGRFAIEFLTQDFRMAGYTGCAANLTQGTVTGIGANLGCTTAFCNLVSPSVPGSNFNPDGIMAYAYVGPTGSELNKWEPDLPGTLFTAGEVRAGTDVVIIQYGSALSTHLTGNTSPQNANIQVIGSSQIASEISAGDILMLSDCKSADILRATNTPGNGGGAPVTIAHSNASNVDSFLSHPYDDSAELMKLVTRIYFIGSGAGGEPALMRRELIQGGVMSAAQDLVQGIEDMRIRFGEDTDGDRIANIYRTADLISAANWRNVVSVRLGILTRTPNNVDGTTDIVAHDLAGTLVTATNDLNRRRQHYNTTVLLRN